MATRLGILGFPNTGKSFSRSFIKKGEECFVISPSGKEHFLKHSEGKPIEKLNISLGPFDSTEKVMANLKLESIHQVIRAFNQTGFPVGVPLKITGNYVICDDVNYVFDYLKFISKHMLHIKNVFQADFTHFVSKIITGQVFRSRKSGGEAFAKYLDLASDCLNNIFIGAEQLRDDLIIATEFHTTMKDGDNYDNFLGVFVPAGRMINDKLLPKSYFDYTLFTHCLSWSENIEEKDRYKFVVVKKEPYDGRMGNMFPEHEKGMIPNNLEVVLNRMREKVSTLKSA